MPRSDMGVYTFHLGRTVFVFGLILALFALRGSCNALVNIAAASISRNPQDPSTHVFYQGPDGELYHRAYVDSSWNSPQKVPTMIPPKPNTPLATWYYDNAQAIHMLHLYYLDSDNQIVSSGGQFDRSTRSSLNWWANYVRTGQGTVSASSNLVVLDVDSTTRLYYIDSDSYVVEVVGNQAARIGPKALPGSNVAAAKPWGDSTSIYVFFVAPDRSLSQMEYDGRKWSEVKTIKPDFAPISSPIIGMGAVAWANPLLIRILFIDQDRHPSEFVYQHGSWLSNPDPTLPPVPAVAPGEPIGASQRGRNSTDGCTYFFLATGLRIVNLIKCESTPWYVGDFGSFNISSPPEATGLSMSDKIALGCGIGFGVAATIIGLLALLKGTKARAKVSDRWKLWVSRKKYQELELTAN